MSVIPALAGIQQSTDSDAKMDPRAGAGMTGGGGDDIAETPTAAELRTKNLALHIPPYLDFLARLACRGSAIFLQRKDYMLSPPKLNDEHTQFA